MTYEEVQNHLDKLQMHKIKLGLEAMRSFLDRVGRPEENLNCIHIAGTNGKGSVCAALAEVLGCCGYRVGVYTSPHLSSVRERFRIGDSYISREAFAAIGARICEVLGEDKITYFEFTTALGLLWFEESGVDLVLLETGLGGRLDATNVVTPLVSVITSISMDHELYLGDTLTAVAGEKAGIIKENIPVVSGATHPEAAAVIREVCREKNAPLFQLCQDFDCIENDDNTWSWLGGDRFDFQKIEGLTCAHASLVHRENDGLTIAVLNLLQRIDYKISIGKIREGLAAVRWPGRMEYFELPFVAGKREKKESENEPKIRRYLLDGAHNPAGVKNLALTLEKKFSYEKLICIWGSMADKDLTSTLAAIVPLADELIFTQPEGERSATVEYISSFLPEDEGITYNCISDGREALEFAALRATEKDLIMIGGSLYLVGAMRSLLLGELVED